MAKSIRSKWKRKQRQIKTAKMKPVIDAKIEQLNEKLELAKKGKLNAVAMEEKPKGYTHAYPKTTGPVELGAGKNNAGLAKKAAKTGEKKAVGVQEKKRRLASGLKKSKDTKARKQELEAEDDDVIVD